LRHYEHDNSVVLDRFTAVRISSMTPRDELIRPVSWRLDFGLERMRVERGDTKGFSSASPRAGPG
jgi:hypothetical protein